MRSWKDVPLWPHQAEALSMIRKFIRERAGGPGPSALVRMPTGTGKSGVIAVAAQRLVTDGDTLCLTPWKALAEQLSNDITERFWTRVGVATPAGRLVHRLLPSTAMSLLAGGRPGTIWVATTATLQQLFSDYPDAYELLASRVKLVIVDEGHYEPAPTWSAAVRGLCRPTVLFSATPYRNDLKYFNISPLEYCFQFSHEEAEEQAYVRGARFETIAFDSPQTFCDSLLGLLSAELPPGPEARVIVRCGTKNSVQLVASELARRGCQVVAFHDRFVGADSTALLRSEVSDPDVESAVFWVHQNKLAEGIDSASFRTVAFYEPFLNERAFVQQVGRVIRNPRREPDETAIVVGGLGAGLEDSWSAYRAYDVAVRENGLPLSPKDTARRQATAQYLEGRFRVPFDCDNVSVHEEYVFPLSARAYAVPKDFSLDALTDSVAKALVEADCEPGAVVTPVSDVRLHAYYVVGNSPLLARSAFVEYRVGYTVYRRIGDLLFFYDTEGISPEELSRYDRLDVERMKRLYSGPHAQLTSVTLLNSDVGRHSARRRSLYARSVGDLGPDLADHTQFTSTVTGFTTTNSADGEEARATRYVGFTKGRIHDAGAVRFDEYMSWLEELARVLNDATKSALPVFDRFAEVVDRPADTTPLNILLDLSQAEFVRTDSGGSEALDIDDLCVGVEGGVFCLAANGQDYAVRLAWDDDKRRYRLTCPELDDRFSMPSTAISSRHRSLVSYLNAEQAFRVVPASNGHHCVYVSGRFLKSRLPLGGKAASTSVDLLELLDGVPELSGIASEKGGPNSATGASWARGCLFHLIDMLGAGTQMAARFDGVDLLVCDDLGTEIADFLALDHVHGRVIGIHAKAFAHAKPLSASALHDISSQALKNLGYLQPYDIGKPKNLPRWNGPWRGGSVGCVDSRIRLGSGQKANAVWAEFRAALRNPRVTREVWLVLGQGPSKDLLIKECRKGSPRPEVLQMLYSLQATWAAVSSVGAKLTVFSSI